MSDKKFTKMDLSPFKGITPGPWFKPIVRNAFSRVLHDVKDVDIEAASFAPEFIDALRTAYAEIDRLLASALTWTTVTDDPTTLPAVGRRVIVEHRNSGMTFAAQIDGPDLWALGSFDGERDTYAILSPGDRWAYIPEVQA